jgi:plasmid stabilization system protein ParE
VTDYTVSPAALRDILEIVAYIEERNSGAAFRMRDRFFGAFQKLAKRPRTGHTRDDLVAREFGVLFWPVGSYLIIFRVAGQTIEIVRVLSGYRDVAAIFAPPLDEEP